MTYDRFHALTSNCWKLKAMVFGNTAVNFQKLYKKDFAILYKNRVLESYLYFNKRSWCFVAFRCMINQHSQSLHCKK